MEEDIINHPSHYECESVEVSYRVEPIELCEMCGFLMAALSKVVGAKVFKALRSTLDQVIDNKELSEDTKTEILNTFKNRMETDMNVSKEDLAVIFKH